MEYSTDLIQTRIQHYSPPVETHDISKIVMIDTFYRPMLLNNIYYDYFVNVFDVPNYTCHPSEVSYIGIQTPYLCYCNGNNY